jgi:hypothetical protein
LLLFAGLAFIHNSDALFISSNALAYFSLEFFETAMLRAIAAGISITITTPPPQQPNAFYLH